MASFPARADSPVQTSVVVTTLNSERTLESCLQSIRRQTASGIELIVVDNFSTDSTLSIAQRNADQVISAGPERSAQRNIGIRKSRGRFVLIIDSDMELREDVVEACIATWNEQPSIVAIPERSFGIGFWAKCKELERSFYVDDKLTAAARFFEYEVLEAIGGFDEQLTAGEDWDVSIRAEALRPLAFAKTLILHNEGTLKLGKLIRKKFYYGASLRRFLAKHGDAARARLSPMRPSLLLNARAIVSNPIVGAGMIVMKGLEMIAGLAGIVTTRNDRKAEGL